MRQKWMGLLPLMLAVCLVLAACSGGEEPAAYDPGATADALLASEAFTQPLDTLEQDIACLMYGVDESTVTGCVAYASLAAGSEGFAVLTFTDEASAGAALEALGDYVKAQQAAQENYLPDEVPKLEHAILERRGSSVVLVVAGDTAAAQAALDAL